MTEATLFALGVTVVVVAGTAAGVLGLLSWEVFNRSVFGRVILVLTGVLWLFTLYHAILMVYHGSIDTIRPFRSVLYTAVAAFIVLMLKTQLDLRAGIDGKEGR